MGPHAAFATPGPALHEVRRERLLKVLHEQSSRALVLLIAPAGFGKSTLAAAYARESEAAVAWLTLHSGDADVQVLFARLCAALESAFAGTHAFASLRSGLDAGADGVGLARLLEADLNRAPAAFMLILDDYHLVQETDAVHEAIDLLVRGIPEFSQIVITARDPPPLSIHGLVVNDAVLVLGTEDLRFTPEEVAALRQGLGGDATRDEEADGWIAGILLGGAPRQLGLSGAGPLEAYVEREVLRQLGRTEQRWLEVLAVLEIITPAASAQLLGPGDWKTRLTTVAQRCAFVAVGEDGTYRLHALIRAALLNRLHRGNGRRLRRVWSIARALAEERHDVPGAVRACQELGDSEGAIALVRRAAEVGLRAGRWPAVLASLSLVTETERRGQPDLCLIEAHALVQSGRPEPARLAAESALEHASYSGDVSVQIRALLELANIGRYSGDLSAAEDWLSAANYLLVHTPLPPPERRSLEGRLLGLRGVCLAIRGQTAEAREALESAQRVLMVDGTSRELAVVQNNLGRFIFARVITGPVGWLWRRVPGTGVPRAIAPRSPPPSCFSATWTCVWAIWSRLEQRFRKSSKRRASPECCGSRVSAVPPWEPGTAPTVGSRTPRSGSTQVCVSPKTLVNGTSWFGRCVSAPKWHCSTTIWSWPATCWRAVRLKHSD